MAANAYLPGYLSSSVPAELSVYVQHVDQRNARTMSVQEAADYLAGLAPWQAEDADRWAALQLVAAYALGRVLLSSLPSSTPLALSFTSTYPVQRTTPAEGRGGRAPGGGLTFRKGALATPYGASSHLDVLVAQGTDGVLSLSRADAPGAAWEAGYADGTHGLTTTRAEAAEWLAGSDRDAAQRAADRLTASASAHADELAVLATDDAADAVRLNVLEEDADGATLYGADHATPAQVGALLARRGLVGQADRQESRTWDAYWSAVESRGRIVRTSVILADGSSRTLQLVRVDDAPADDAQAVAAHRVASPDSDAHRFRPLAGSPAMCAVCDGPVLNGDVHPLDADATASDERHPFRVHGVQLDRDAASQLVAVLTHLDADAAAGAVEAAALDADAARYSLRAVGADGTRHEPRRGLTFVAAVAALVALGVTATDAAGALAPVSRATYAEIPLSLGGHVLATRDADGGPYADTGADTLGRLRVVLDGLNARDAADELGAFSGQAAADAAPLDAWEQELYARWEADDLAADAGRAARDRDELDGQEWTGRAQLSTDELAALHARQGTLTAAQAHDADGRHPFALDVSDLDGVTDGDTDAASPAVARILAVLADAAREDGRGIGAEAFHEGTHSDSPLSGEWADGHTVRSVTAEAVRVVADDTADRWHRNADRIRAQLVTLLDAVGDADQDTADAWEDGYRELAASYPDWACDACAQAAANDEWPDTDDQPRPLSTVPYGHVLVTDGTPEFRTPWSGCVGCGTHLAGDYWPATLLDVR